MTLSITRSLCDSWASCYYQRRKSEAVLSSAECVCCSLSYFSGLTGSYSYHKRCHALYDSFGRNVSARACVSVCPQDNLKTIACICFLFGSYGGLRKISDEFTCQDDRSTPRSFFGGSRSLNKAMSCFVAGSKIPSQMTSFSTGTYFYLTPEYRAGDVWRGPECGNITWGANFYIMFHS